MLDKYTPIPYNNTEVITMRDIGKNIRSIRIDKKITQEELAEKLFVTRQTVSNYETGKSRPDIDMLLQIAQVLDTDVNALLYGPAIPQDKKRSRTRAILCGCMLLLLCIGFGILYPMAKRVYMTGYYIAPLLLLRLTVQPAILFLLGWLLMELTDSIFCIRLTHTKAIKSIRYVLAGVIIFLVTIQLPYLIFLTIGLIQYLIHNRVALVFPDIPIYTTIAHAVMNMSLKLPLLYLILAIACRLFKSPKRQNTNQA